jgi:hypothetical protein
MIKQELVEKLQELKEKKGTRFVSRLIINLRLASVSGIGISELPDTVELCNICDEVDKMLKEDITKETVQRATSYVFESIDEDFVKEMIFS